MRSFNLPNGLKVIIEPRKTETVSIELNVHVGSNLEPGNIAGISHFLEHMMFEGTKQRTAKQIGECIENIGGELNAATSNERTFYYSKVPKKHFLLALGLISDIIQNPLFDRKLLEKERNVVLEEIKMTTDQPLYYQWQLFESSLFEKNPARFPIYGSVKTVKAITRQKLSSFFRKWYIPNNMTLCIVGDAKITRPLLLKYFGAMKRKPLPKTPLFTEPPSKRPKTVYKTRDIQNAYMVLGYKTPKRTHKDAYALDLLSAIFCKGLSGRIVEEIRNKRGLVYSVGCAYDSYRAYGFFAFYLNTMKSKVPLCRDLILKEIKNLNTLSDRELKEAKDFVEGKQIVLLEDNQKRGDQLIYWDHVKDASLLTNYIKNIKAVKKADILRVAKKYLDENYTMTVLQGK